MVEARSKSDLTDPGLPALGDALDFLRLIWAVDHALQRRSKSMTVALGITGPQRLLIRIIGRFPSVHARQLADILHLHPSSLTALLKRLEARGLIRRLPDGRDRRRLLLGLTRKGQVLNSETPGTIEADVQRMLRVVSKRDLEGARVALGVLTRTLDGRLAAKGRKRGLE
jgi:Transcriptional regulators